MMEEVTKSTRCGRKGKFTDDHKAFIIAEYMCSNKSFKELCDYHKIGGRTTIQRWITKMNESQSQESRDFMRLVSQKIYELKSK